MRIHLHRPVITAEDRRSVESVLADPHTGATVVRDLEAALCRLTGYKHAIACASATVGIMVALESGTAAKQVGVPALTFAATHNAARRSGEGCKLVMLDSDPMTWVAEQSGLPPRAVTVPVELNGAEVAVGSVIDSACALRRGMRETQTCIASVVSFNASKTITGLGGGAILTDSEPTAQLARRLIDQGKEDGDATVCSIYGLNGRIPYLCAALALSQITRFDEIAARKSAQLMRYRSRLTRLAWQPTIVAPWLAMPMLAGAREVELTIARLKLAGIEARRMYQIAAAVSVERAPHAHKIARRAIQLPMGLDVTDEDIDEVCRIVLDN